MARNKNVFDHLYLIYPNIPTAMTRKVKLNTTGIKFTPSAFITYYEVNANFSISNEDELLTLTEVKEILNSHQPIIKGDATSWSIGISIPLKEMQKKNVSRLQKR
jgi:hypothetical protein